MLDMGQKITPTTISLARSHEISESRSFNIPDGEGRWIVLYFYPKDDTSGCTREAVGFSELKDDFTQNNTIIIGVSKDSLDKHDKFREKHGLTIELSSDQDGQLCDTFGTWVEKSMFGKTYMGIERSTFLIDESGTIRHAWRRVKVTGHVENVLKKLQEIRTQS